MSDTQELKILTKEQVSELEVKLYPRCLNHEQKQPVLSATGYMLPCCWSDCGVTFEGMESLVQPHLHISNVDTVEDIVLSPEWDQFFNDLIEKPRDAPLICKKYCCTTNSFKNFIPG